MPLECNAFVIPGGKVFVYSGILDVALNDDGLAAVLGHEIAHNLARHQAESMSTMVMLEPLRWVLLLLDYSGQTFGLGRIIGHLLMDFGIQRPASRKQEGEADFIGLMMMSKACFDPKAAIGLWERMEIATKDQQIPQWLSTHPSVGRHACPECQVPSILIISCRMLIELAPCGSGSPKPNRLGMTANVQ
jgi:predicted Zn-dependent protease